LIDLIDFKVGKTRLTTDQELDDNYEQVADYQGESQICDGLKKTNELDLHGVVLAFHQIGLSELMFGQHALWVENRKGVGEQQASLE